MPEGDFIVAPKDAKEVSAVLKIANYYKIPVTTWGAGGGTQGGAIPVCGGIVLDTKRMNKIYDVNDQAMYIECGTGAIYKHIEWAANEVGYATMHYPSSLTCSALKTEFPILMISNMPKSVTFTMKTGNTLKAIISGQMI